MYMGLTKAVNQITKSQETLYLFALWQRTQAPDHHGVDGKKLTQAAS